MRGFHEQDINRAKELLFEVSSSVAALKDIRKKSRKNTFYKTKAEGDVEDVLHLCYEADRLRLQADNSFPVISLEEVDCGTRYQ